MNKTLSLALLVAGIVLLAFGISAQDSVLSGAKEVLTGTPTDRSIWLITVGIIGIVIGGLGALSRRGHN